MDLTYFLTMTSDISYKASGSAAQSQEFVVRAPKNTNMTYGVVKFNPSNKVDFTAAESVRIERENNLKDYKAAYDMDVLPKFGAGSEFGREEREEARRKKYGIHRKKYNVEDQPWLLKLGSGKSARKFKGTKEGGILENASYYIFTQCADGAFDAFPVKDWHSFNPTIKYKHLNIDEAEEQFNRRDKTLNYFNIMVKKRVKGPDADANEKEEEEEKQKKNRKKKSKDFLLTDMDEWAILSEDENEDSDDDRQKLSDSDDSVSGGKKKGQRRKIKKDHKTNSGDEAVEESDEADEGREVDYMTDTDSDDDDMYGEKGRSKLEKYKQTGVEDEEGLQKIIGSDDEDEEEMAEKEESASEASDREEKGSQSGSSGSSSESESDPEKNSSFASALFMQKKDPLSEKKERERKDKEKKKSKKDKKDKKEKNGRKRRNSESSEASNLTNSRSATPTISSQGEKKEESHVAKRAKMETPPVSGTEGLTEDMVKRYLMRKPMTTGDLMKKFKNIGLTKEKIAFSITEILKKLNPERKEIDGKLHLWIKKSE